MRALVVYESVYGNTHAVATRIGQGLEERGEVRVLSVHDATADQVEWADLVVVGGPTHGHGLSSTSSRKAAAASAANSDTALDPEATGPGLRHWFKELPKATGKRAVAFDTRLDAAALLTGRASHAIERRLRTHGFTVLAESDSFLVDKHNHLLPGQEQRAVHWGGRLAEVLFART